MSFKVFWGFVGNTQCVLNAKSLLRQKAEKANDYLAPVAT